MNRSAGPLGRFRLLSSSVAAVATVVVLGPPAHADDDLFDPGVPPIVVGGTVDTQATIVVDPQTTPGTPAGPIDPSKPIPVDTRTQPQKPICCIKWFPNANPPVVEVESRRIDDRRIAYLDNHGRYWLYDRGERWDPNNPGAARSQSSFEQVGGWPAPSPAQTTPTNLPPNMTSLFPDQNAQLTPGQWVTPGGG